MKRLLLIAALTLALLSPTPAQAAPALRWNDCTIEYTVHNHGHSTRQLNKTIREIANITGLKFRKSNIPNLTINLTDRQPTRKKLGHTRWKFNRSNIYHATVNIYRRTYGKSARVQHNIYRHELGHALGLRHASRWSNDVMRSTLTGTRSTRAWKRNLRNKYQHCR